MNQDMSFLNTCKTNFIVNKKFLRSTIRKDIRTQIEPIDESTLRFYADQPSQHPLTGVHTRKNLHSPRLASNSLVYIRQYHFTCASKVPNMFPSFILARVASDFKLTLANENLKMTISSYNDRSIFFFSRAIRQQIFVIFLLKQHFQLRSMIFIHLLSK